LFDLTDPIGLAIAFAVVLLGSAVQGAAGFGLGLIAAPILLLLDPRWVPGPLMAAGIGLTILVAYRERDDIDLVGMRFAFVGRTIGTVAAAVLLTSLSANAFDVIFGSLVLLAVGLSMLGMRISPTPGHAVSAGLLSGFMGTISSIGGPPLALLYQREGGPRLRATLSALFVTGAVISVAALAVIGRFGIVELWLTGFLVPAALLGFVVAGWLREAVDRAGVRPLVLALSAASATVVLIRAFG
jgi:uncharacterized membrane protein YfcA